MDYLELIRQNCERISKLRGQLSAACGKGDHKNVASLTEEISSLECSNKELDMQDKHAKDEQWLEDKHAKDEQRLEDKHAKDEQRLILEHKVNEWKENSGGNWAKVPTDILQMLTQLQTMKDEHEGALEKIKEKHEEALKEMRQKHQGALKEMRQRHEGAEMRQRHEGAKMRQQNHDLAMKREEAERARLEFEYFKLSREKRGLRVGAYD
jgi:hypothetical protein